MTTSNIVLGEQKSYYSQLVHPSYVSILDHLVTNYLNISQMCKFNNTIKNSKFNVDNEKGIYLDIEYHTKVYDLLTYSSQEKSGFYLDLAIPRIINCNYQLFPETDYINSSRRDQITQMWLADDLLIRHKEQYPTTPVYVIPYSFYTDKYQLVFHKALED